MDAIYQRNVQMVVHLFTCDGCESHVSTRGNFFYLSSGCFVILMGYLLQPTRPSPFNRRPSGWCQGFVSVYLTFKVFVYLTSSDGFFSIPGITIIHYFSNPVKADWRPMFCQITPVSQAGGGVTALLSTHWLVWNGWGHSCTTSSPSERESKVDKRD